ncbi:SdrD B-like domain-containing protein, partial [Parasporobacterium paucivorans]
MLVSKSSTLRKIKRWLAIMTTFSMMSLTIFASTPVFAASGSMTYDLQGWAAGTVGNAKYTDGNLGKNYYEGCWVPYVITLDNIQAEYVYDSATQQLLSIKDGSPFVLQIEYDYTVTSGPKVSRFMDGIKEIQVAVSNQLLVDSGNYILKNDGTINLDPVKSYPSGSNNGAYPISTQALVDAAMNNADSTNTFTGFNLLDLPNQQTNIAANTYDPNAASPTAANIGSTTTARRQTVILTKDLLASGITAAQLQSTQSIVFYYQLHLARSVFWNNTTLPGAIVTLADSLNGTQGTWIYQDSTYAPGENPYRTFTCLGAGGISGSSGQVRMGGSFGDQTVPNPQVPEATGTLSGYKFEDINNNNVWDAGEPALSGWGMDLYLKIGSSEILSGQATTDANGFYSFTNITRGITWIVKEISQTGYTQYYPYAGVVLGGTNVVNPIQVSDTGNIYAEYGWSVVLIAPNITQGQLNFGNASKGSLTV